MASKRRPAIGYRYGRAICLLALRHGAVGRRVVMGRAWMLRLFRQQYGEAEAAKQLAGYLRKTERANSGGAAPCWGCGARTHLQPSRVGQRLGVRCLYRLGVHCDPCGRKHFAQRKKRRDRSHRRNGSRCTPAVRCARAVLRCLRNGAGASA